MEKLHSQLELDKNNRLFYKNFNKNIDLNKF